MKILSRRYIYSGEGSDTIEGEALVVRHWWQKLWFFRRYSELFISGPAKWISKNNSR